SRSPTREPGIRALLSGGRAGDGAPPANRKPRQGRPGLSGGRARGKTRSSRKYLTASPNDRRFPGQAGRLRRGNRLDEARIVIPDIADARADRPGDHVVGRVGGQERLQVRLVRWFFAEP